MFSTCSTTTRSNQQVAQTCILNFRGDSIPGHFEVCVLAPTSNKLIANTTRLFVMENSMWKVEKKFQLKQIEVTLAIANVLLLSSVG